MTLLFTPGGVVNTDRQEVRCPPEWMRMLSVFAETAGEIGLGLHCVHCKQDLQGKNARGDNAWLMECGCRTYVGKNPLPAGQRSVS